MQQVDAIIAVHDGKVHSNEIKQKLGQDRRVIVPFAAALTDIPPDTPRTLALHRAAYKQLGQEELMHRENTDAELRKALKETVSGCLSQAAARAR